VNCKTHSILSGFAIGLTLCNRVSSFVLAVGPLKNLVKPTRPYHENFLYTHLQLHPVTPQCTMLQTDYVTKNSMLKKNLGIFPGGLLANG